MDLVSVLLLFLLPALALAADRFATRDAPLLAFGDIVSFLLHCAQDSGTCNLLPESLEQTPL